MLLIINFIFIVITYLQAILCINKSKRIYIDYNSNSNNKYLRIKNANIKRILLPDTFPLLYGNYQVSNLVIRHLDQNMSKNRPKHSFNNNLIKYPCWLIKFLKFWWE
jgi:hypothetical protein